MEVRMGRLLCFFIAVTVHVVDGLLGACVGDRLFSLRYVFNVLQRNQA
jgi:hypothetical protein